MNAGGAFAFGKGWGESLNLFARANGGSAYNALQAGSKALMATAGKGGGSAVWAALQNDVLFGAAKGVVAGAALGAGGTALRDASNGQVSLDNMGRGALVGAARGGVFGAAGGALIGTMRMGGGFNYTPFGMPGAASASTRNVAARAIKRRSGGGGGGGGDYGGLGLTPADIARMERQPAGPRVVARGRLYEGGTVRGRQEMNAGMNAGASLGRGFNLLGI